MRAGMRVICNIKKEDQRMAAMKVNVVAYKSVGIAVSLPRKVKQCPH
jgi:hypothetical protein